MKSLYQEKKDLSKNFKNQIFKLKGNIMIVVCCEKALTSISSETSEHKVKKSEFGDI